MAPRGSVGEALRHKRGCAYKPSGAERMQGRKAAGAPALGRVLPTPPGAQSAPLPPLARAPPVTAGSTARKALNGPLEFVPRGARCAKSAARTRRRCVRACLPPGQPLSTLACSRVQGAEPLGGRSPTSVYDTPQDQSLQIRQLLKENQNLKLKARAQTAFQARRTSLSSPACSPRAPRGVHRCTSWRRSSAAR